MLNMLIAIMGNTFSERSSIKSQIRMRDHLRFVISNWYLSDLAFENKSQLKYIVTAFAATENADNSEQFENKVHEGIYDLYEAVRDNGHNTVHK